MDREKVIKGLEICTTRPCYCKDCPYEKTCALDSQELMEDVLALMKEQEEQVKSWIEQIANKQLSVGATDPISEYEKGIWDGLQIAWNIISEGSVK